MSRVALVCAASKGLGRASAEALARDGIRLAICSRGGPALRDTEAAIRAAGGEVISIEADLRRAADVANAVETTVRTFGGLDILVTNTGGPPSGPFLSFEDATWTDAIDSLLMSVVRLCRAAIPHMRARGGGRIINVTSISVKQPIQGLVLHRAARGRDEPRETLAGAGVRQHSRQLRRNPATRTDRVVSWQVRRRRAKASRGTIRRPDDLSDPLGRTGEATRVRVGGAVLASPRKSPASRAR